MSEAVMLRCIASCLETSEYYVGKGEVRSADWWHDRAATYADKLATYREFSRVSMEEHWRAGYHDARRTLRHPEVLKRPDNHEGFSTFDLAADGRE